MPATIVATAGAADANSYVTLEDAKVYVATMLHAEPWHSVQDADRIVALIRATRLLDQTYDWYGVRTVSGTQSLAFPRQGVRRQDVTEFDEEIFFEEDEIPVWLEEAATELAVHLLGGNREGDQSAQLSSVNFGGLSANFAGTSKAALIPDAVERLVSPYARKKGGTVRAVMRR
jgi:hypothetical protein